MPVPIETVAVPGGALLALLTVIMFIARGRLIPSSTVDRIETRYQAEITTLKEQNALLKEIADRERDNAIQTRAQLDKILVVADTTERLMIAMRSKVET